MQDNNEIFLSEISDYYSRKLEQHGKTSKGVDWNSDESQALRFQQLCKIISTKEKFSLNDVGCGYGALLEFLINQYRNFAYHGFDLSDDMINAATESHDNHRNARFVTAREPDTISEYGIASGIFNVRLNYEDDVWFDYIASTLDILDQTSKLGFAFNCLTSYSDLNKKRDYLYYADPCQLFNLCKQRYSLNVALLHDYELYEFTILVRKKT